jgi:hypothetical protein
MVQLPTLFDHRFAQDVMRDAMAAQKLLGDAAPFKIQPEYKRDPDEHEYFLLHVGSCLAEVLTAYQQLTHIPVYLANHRQTPAMEKAGINRHSQIVYHIESYLIRTQGLLDRVLKLVDAVFHLLNAPRACRADVVLQNVKVKRTKVPTVVKRMDKLLDRYSMARNAVVHHKSVQEDELRTLEMYYLVEQIERVAPGTIDRRVTAIKQERTHEVIRAKKKEFTDFNVELAAALSDIFDVLAPHYAKEEPLLRLRLSKNPT